MFINRLLNRGPLPVIEQMVKFTEKRSALLEQNVVNLSTPNYQQQDLSLDKFQKLLAERAELRDRPVPGGLTRGGADRTDVARDAAGNIEREDVRFDDVTTGIENPSSNILFHDRNNRSVEQLMSDHAQNAMLHNMMIELLRKQFSQIQEALREKVS